MNEKISTAEVLNYYQLPFLDLLWQAQKVHRENFVAGEIQRSTLLSIKTGGCSENCGYCSQSARHGSAVQREKMLSLPEVVKAASAAKDKGASRFCMGAAWRGPKDKDLQAVIKMVEAVKSLGLETCVTLGELKAEQAEQLKSAGLDYYNHNLDTDKKYYEQVVQTHSYQDRLSTLDNVRSAGIKVCSGGIIGMGETRENRAALIAQLANLPTPPESVPINNLVPIAGTSFADKEGVDDFEFVRTIAVARLAMPTSWVRLSAGRDNMPPNLQALCFLAGANSIFYGEKLLTTDNADVAADQLLFKQLDLVAV